MRELRCQSQDSFDSKRIRIRFAFEEMKLVIGVVRYEVWSINETVKEIEQLLVKWTKGEVIDHFLALDIFDIS